ncbi:hypothetical protein PAPHI01_1932 [Pancytospora philotis]|nr:hypothetical protein PAPHI01_1932 [Pancytospora philotis]
MKDLYNVDQALKQKAAKKKKEASDGEALQSEVDKEILAAAERTEAQNYKKAHAARLKLESAAELQKGTTEEMHRQGEKITHAKKSALKVHKNAEGADELADTIEKESHLFNFGVPFWGGIKKWWSKNRKEKKDVGAIEQTMGSQSAGSQSEQAEASEESEYEGNAQTEEYVPGEAKTNEELGRILHSVRHINKTANKQSKMAKEQETDLRDINVLNEYSKKKVDKTDSKLKKGL